MTLIEIDAQSRDVDSKLEIFGCAIMVATLTNVDRLDVMIRPPKQDDGEMFLLNRTVDAVLWLLLFRDHLH